jgi:hypothetical protein
MVVKGKSVINGVVYNNLNCEIFIGSALIDDNFEEEEKEEEKENEEIEKDVEERVKNSK